ncbi:regulator of cell morphogenesis and NO signaling [Alteromonadaceae bacterium 2753L.S.0a.02]|nr:regulator of cell morphogenesis and NO signaling [Alteromonadaceae bacterium 2753L.S.0a.02]
MKLLSTSVLDIANNLSGASRVFHYFGIDLCEHSDKRLEELSQAQNINQADLLEEFNTLPKPPDLQLAPWKKLSTAKFIDKLLAEFHYRHRKHLPEIIRLSRHLDKHLKHPALPRHLSHKLINFQEDLEQHMIAEEQELFPMLKSAPVADIKTHLSAMHFKHREHDRAMQSLETMTGQLCTPSGVNCATLQVLYSELGRFLNELRTHMVLEDEILYQRITQ